MTGWRVDPAGLNTILTDTNEAIQAVGAALEGAGGTVDDVVAAAGYDGIVATAYSDFLQEIFEGAVTQMFSTYSAALEGTANAANAYMTGDEENAATIAAAIAASNFDAAQFAQTRNTAPGGGGGGGGW